MMEFEEIVLLLCGNFNPITNMHLRMFEIAKDHLTNIGYSVYKGLISPYERNASDKSNVSIEHRIAMIKYALNSSNWIQLSSWHCEKFDLATISTMLQHYQTRFNFVFKNQPNDGKCDPTNYRFIVKLMCGADVFVHLVSITAAAHELHNILKNHGLVVISRAGFDVESIIDDNDIFWMHRKNIIVVRDTIENQISSHKIRKAISRCQSVKYLVDDAVEKYINLYNLYAPPTCEHQSFDKSKHEISCLETSDTFFETWRPHDSRECSSSTEIANTLRKKSKLSHRSRTRKESYFGNVDKSKLIGIPVTEDGVIQIIADKETNL